MNELTIVLATQPGREAQLARARAAYAAYAPGAHLVEASGSTGATTTWSVIFHKLAIESQFVLFVTDAVEPHPGFAEAGIAAAKLGRVATPTLWTLDGERDHDKRDWVADETSCFPLLETRKARQVGPPPYTSDAPLGYIVRCHYAFTVYAD